MLRAGIALLVAALGLIVALDVRWPMAAAMALVAGFAIFHGYAHGEECQWTPPARPMRQAS